MTHRVLAPILGLALCAGSLSAWQAKAPQTRQQKAPDSNPAQTKTITGVIDQREGDYVISDSENLQMVAVLQGVGFEKENFARFVGMPVQVRGTLVAGKNPPVLQVRNIADIHEVSVPTK